MYKKITLMLVCTILISMECFSQNRSISEVPIHVSLLSGTKINIVQGSLDFENIKSKSISLKKTIIPSKGVLFELNNVSNRKIVIEVNNFPLTPQNNTAGNKLIFTPKVLKTNLNNNFDEQKLISGNSNKQHFFIGGELIITENIPAGIYSGELTVTFVY